MQFHCVFVKFSISFLEIVIILNWILAVKKSFKGLASTLCKFKKFSVTQILCEINFSHRKTPKTAIEIGQFSKIRIQSLWNSQINNFDIQNLQKLISHKISGPEKFTISSKPKFKGIWIVNLARCDVFNSPKLISRKI